MTTLSPEVIEKWSLEFIAKNPVPQYCYWNPVRGIYITAHLQQSAVCARYNRELGIWLDSRKSLVIELPKDDGTISQNTYVIDAIAHIESQGYQVNQNAEPQPAQAANPLVDSVFAASHKKAADTHGKCPHCSHECAQAAAIPEGWQLVPVDPTPAMLKEIHLIDEFSERALIVRYKAMLSASPKPL